MTHHPQSSPQFYLTVPAPCPYLERQFERKVFANLGKNNAAELNDLLSQGGFRRSQNIAYRPACDACHACISVRVLVEEFNKTRSMRWVWQRNANLTSCAYKAQPSTEQYNLFRRYVNVRHRTGGMYDMGVLDYAMMVEDTHVNTQVVEYRRRGPDVSTAGINEGVLVAVALTDVMADGLSMVYSFYDPDERNVSLGTFIILDHIKRARALKLPYVYLGYWVEGSSKMQYKIRFTPQEHRGINGWERRD
ncbi:arginyltransferase [Mesorhizobium sp. YR577]|uniref:arginyltransferase n=1 Tax=Mesorhizobium sp. YR577 TaxID=1884373 RepID=UPI0008DF35EF|nr:arginyltransferase [Mesorhizobium sp. YR577]SFU21731.1 arginine-tRNA-protein transferase [Mesorhizobium sp. YR577]